MPNGSLETHLGDTVNLTPEVRVQVACDVSSALAYLHAGTDRVIIHRDVKRCVCVCVCVCVRTLSRGCSGTIGKCASFYKKQKQLIEIVEMIFQQL